MDAHEFRALVKDLTQVGRVCTETDLNTIHSINVATFAKLQAQARNHILNNTESPTLFAHLSDGWSGYTTSRHEAEAKDGLKVTRHGKVRHEYMLENGFLRTRNENGDDTLFFLTREPRPMVMGRSAWNVWTCLVEWYGRLRELGCQGLVIHFYVQDGALYLAVKRKLRVFHCIPYDEECSAIDSPDSGEMASLLDWNLHLRCKAHPLQNSIVWALKPWTPGDVARRAHLAIKSLRTSSKEFHKKADAVLVNRLRYRIATSDPEEAREYWEFVNVTAAWLAIFVEVDPLADGTYLWVNPSILQDPCGWEKTKACLLYCWRLFDWADTRWLRSGRASRFYIRAKSAGMGFALLHVLDDPWAAKQYLLLHGRPSQDVLKMFVVAAFASVPAEAPHLQLLIDDRFLRFGAAYRELVPVELTKIANYSEALWRRLTIVFDTGFDWKELRSWCQMGAVTSSAFMDNEVWRDLTRPPHNITQGSIQANLNELSARGLDTITDETHQKIRRLQSVHYPNERLVEGVELWRDAPGTVATCEEAHASGELHCKHHSYNQPTMLSRACLHKARCLYMLDKVQTLARRLDVKIQRLDLRQPQKVTGRHMYFGSQATARKTHVDIDEDVFTVMQDEMRTHATDYIELPIMEQHRWEEEARRKLDDVHGS